MASGGKEYQLAIKIAGRLDSSFNTAVSGAQKSLTGLGGKALVGATKLTAKALAGTAAAVAAVGAVSVKTGKEFDTAMSQVAATMGKTMQEMQNEVGSVELAWGDFSGNLREYALEMGKHTAFSASQAAEALNYMALAGYDTQTSMSMLPNVLNLAAAGGMELATASDMVTDTQSAFGISLARTSQMVDEMAKAASTGNTSVQQLGDAFLTVGGLAKELNGGLVTLADGTTASVDGIQELEIAFTAMANSRIKGSEAGTHMRNMLLKLSSPTAAGVKQLKKLGVEVFNDEGAMRSLSDVFGDLSGQLDAMTQQEKLNAISDLFNARDTATAEALLAAVGSDWDSIGESILNAQGAAEKMAATQLDNLNGDVTYFKSALEGLEISISDVLTPTLRDFVQFGTGELKKLSNAAAENGLDGIVDMIGEIMLDCLAKGSEYLPKFIDFTAQVLDSIVAGVDQNSDKIGEALARAGTSLINALIKLTPKMIVTGAHLIVAFISGLIDHFPEIKAAAGEAVGYLMTEAKNALKKYVNFLGDDEVAPFKKILALLPAVVGGFVGLKKITGISGGLTDLIGKFKGIGKAAPGLQKGMGSAGKSMSTFAQNILGVGAGIALAAAGIYILVQAAKAIADAGPGATVALIMMVGGIIALMAIASKLGPKLQACKEGLIAFGVGVLLAAAGLALLAFSAVQIAQAGPLAIGALALLEGGLIGLMAVAGAMGPKLATAAPGLIAFGVAIVLAGAGMAIMSYAAVQLAQAGGPAIAVLAGMAVAIAAFMAIAGAFGPALLAGGAGMLLLGAGLLLAAAGMALLANTAIMLADAGAPALIIMAALAVGIIAFGAACGALAPILLAGAAALAAFGAALLIVSTAAVVGSAALLIISLALPALAQHGAAGAVAIVQLGAAMTVFAAGAALAGAGCAAAAVGFGVMAVAAGAALLTFTPLAVEIVAVAASIATISACAATAAAGMNSMKNSASGILGSMAKLAISFAPVAAAILPFTAAVAASTVAVAAFAAGLAALDIVLAAMLGMVNGTALGLQMMVLAMVALCNQLGVVGISLGIASMSFVKFQAASAPMIAALTALVVPLGAAGVSAVAFGAGMTSATAMLTAGAAAAIAFSAALKTAAIGFAVLSIAASAGTNKMKAVMVAAMTAIIAGYTSNLLSLQKTTNSSFASISGKIVSEMNRAKSAVLSAVSSMKSAMNFSWSLPHLKLPHINISGSFSIEPPSAPKFSVNWYKQGGILDGAQIFGATENSLLGGGEAGKEAVLPLSELWKNMRSVMADVIGRTDTAAGIGILADRLESAILGRRNGNLSDLSDALSGTDGESSYVSENQSYQITYAPTLQFFGGTPSQDDIVSAGRVSQDEFNEMMEEWMKTRSRKVFSGG